MNVLVFGGTRYFGKRLVSLLLERGHAITLVTRGKTPDPFGDRVARHALDRADSHALAELARSGSWDVAVDQICYSPDEAASACEAFRGKVGRWVHTSTGSVYAQGGEEFERDFEPKTYAIRRGGRADFDYGEAKRLAEAVYFQQASFPVAAMRIPIVLGPDDYTRRLEFHVERARAGRPIVVPALDAETCFIHAAEAARFLLWLAEGAVTGPVNACAAGRISMRELLARVEARVGRAIDVRPSGAGEDLTPFLDERSRYFNTALAESLGFRFEPLRPWLFALIDGM